MKKFYLSLSILLLSQTAMAAPISCGGKSTNNVYSVTVDGSWSTATVSENDEVVEFGNLTCTMPKPKTRNNPFLVCYTSHVNDAGFFATLYYSGPTNAILKLNRSSIAGSTLIATLPCVMAVNSY